MTANQLRAWCLSMPGTVEEFPFNPDTSVFKVHLKIFAITALAADPLKVSVKCDPDLGAMLRSVHDSIVPGYHLNKRHWITVTLNADAADRIVQDLIEDSYDLVKPRPGTARARLGRPSRAGP